MGEDEGGEIQKQWSENGWMEQKETGGSGAINPPGKAK